MQSLQNKTEKPSYAFIACSGTSLEKLFKQRATITTNSDSPKLSDWDHLYMYCREHNIINDKGEFILKELPPLPELNAEQNRRFNEIFNQPYCFKAHTQSGEIKTTTIKLGELFTDLGFDHFKLIGSGVAWVLGEAYFRPLLQGLGIPDELLTDELFEELHHLPQDFDVRFKTPNANVDDLQHLLSPIYEKLAAKLNMSVKDIKNSITKKWAADYRHEDKYAMVCLELYRCNHEGQLLLNEKEQPIKAFDADLNFIKAIQRNHLVKRDATYLKIQLSTQKMELKSKFKTVYEPLLHYILRLIDTDDPSTINLPGIAALIAGTTKNRFPIDDRFFENLFQLITQSKWTDAFADKLKSAVATHCKGNPLSSIATAINTATFLSGEVGQQTVSLIDPFLLNGHHFLQRLGRLIIHPSLGVVAAKHLLTIFSCMGLDKEVKIHFKREGYLKIKTVEEEYSPVSLFIKNDLKMAIDWLSNNLKEYDISIELESWIDRLTFEGTNLPDTIQEIIQPFATSPHANVQQISFLLLLSWYCQNPGKILFTRLLFLYTTLPSNLQIKLVDKLSEALLNNRRPFPLNAIEQVIGGIKRLANEKNCFVPDLTALLFKTGNPEFQHIAMKKLSDEQNLGRSLNIRLQLIGECIDKSPSIAMEMFTTYLPDSSKNAKTSTTLFVKILIALQKSKTPSSDFKNAIQVFTKSLSRKDLATIDSSILCQAIAYLKTVDVALAAHLTRQMPRKRLVATSSTSRPMFLDTFKATLTKSESAQKPQTSQSTFSGTNLETRTKRKEVPKASARITDQQPPAVSNASEKEVKRSDTSRVKVLTSPPTTTTEEISKTAAKKITSGLKPALTKTPEQLPPVQVDSPKANPPKVAPKEQIADKAFEITFDLFSDPEPVKLSLPPTQEPSSLPPTSAKKATKRKAQPSVLKPKTSTAKKTAEPINKNAYLESFKKTAEQGENPQKLRADFLNLVKKETSVEGKTILREILELMLPLQCTLTSNDSNHGINLILVKSVKDLYVSHPHEYLALFCNQRKALLVTSNSTKVQAYTLLVEMLAKMTDEAHYSECVKLISSLLLNIPAKSTLITAKVITVFEKHLASSNCPLLSLPDNDLLVKLLLSWIKHDVYLNIPASLAHVLLKHLVTQPLPRSLKDLADVENIFDLLNQKLSSEDYRSDLEAVSFHLIAACRHLNQPQRAVIWAKATDEPSEAVSNLYSQLLETSNFNNCKELLEYNDGQLFGSKNLGKKWNNLAQKQALRSASKAAKIYINRSALIYNEQDKAQRNEISKLIRVLSKDSTGRVDAIQLMILYKVKLQEEWNQLIDSECSKLNEKILVQTWDAATTTHDDITDIATYIKLLPQLYKNIFCDISLLAYLTESSFAQSIFYPSSEEDKTDMRRLLLENARLCVMNGMFETVTSEEIIAYRDTYCPTVPLETLIESFALSPYQSQSDAGFEEADFHDISIPPTARLVGKVQKMIELPRSNYINKQVIKCLSTDGYQKLAADEKQLLNVLISILGQGLDPDNQSCSADAISALNCLKRYRATIFRSSSAEELLSVKMMKSFCRLLETLDDKDPELVKSAISSLFDDLVVNSFGTVRTTSRSFQTGVISPETCHQRLLTLWNLFTKVTPSENALEIYHDSMAKVLEMLFKYRDADGKGLQMAYLTFIYNPFVYNDRFMPRHREKILNLLNFARKNNKLIEAWPTGIFETTLVIQPKKPLIKVNSVPLDSNSLAASAIINLVNNPTRLKINDAIEIFCTHYKFVTKDAKDFHFIVERILRACETFKTDNRQRLVWMSRLYPPILGEVHRNTDFKLFAQYIRICVNAMEDESNEVFEDFSGKLNVLSSFISEEKFFDVPLEVRYDYIRFFALARSHNKHTSNQCIISAFQKLVLATENYTDRDLPILRAFRILKDTLSPLNSEALLFLTHILLEIDNLKIFDTHPAFFDECLSIIQDVGGILLTLTSPEDIDFAQVTSALALEQPVARLKLNAIKNALLAYHNKPAQSK